MARWSIEARVTRGPGDVCQALPQLLDKAAWVHVCVKRVPAGNTLQIRTWCGARHGSVAEAAEHAATLNMSEATA